MKTLKLQNCSCNQFLRDVVNEANDQNEESERKKNVPGFVLQCVYLAQAINIEHFQIDLDKRRLA